jgi:ATP-dependent exoDNAse (exonuclease V) beta subunit
MWSECGWRYRLVYKDKIPFYSSNEFTAFGTAIHATCENVLFGNKDYKPEDYFIEQFAESRKEIEKPNDDLANEMLSQGRTILPQVQGAVKDYFGDYEVISTEEELLEPVKEDLDFKGYIDMVLKTPDGKYHILDWKTCSWGWNAQKKSSKLMTYQLTLYKKYFCEKYNIDPINVETYFGLLKRTAKKNNVEIFRVTSGNKKTENALKSLNDFIYNVEKGLYFKNRLSCRYCSFYKTEHCR